MSKGTKTPQQTKRKLVLDPETGQITREDEPAVEPQALVKPQAPARPQAKPVQAPRRIYD